MLVSRLVSVDFTATIALGDGMVIMSISPTNSKYDERHDVLHVFLGSRANAFTEEDFPGVYIDRNDDTDEIVGLTLMDYKKRRRDITKWLPQYEFKV